MTSIRAAMAAALATLSLPLGHELVVDLFAGGGGASAGIAGGYREPDVAVNHSPAAIAAHEANHPGTLHFRADVWEVDPIAATGGQPVALLWASPDCRHFSKAKGGKPVSDGVRSLADVVITWARATRPRIIMLENVEEFTTKGKSAVVAACLEQANGGGYNGSGQPADGPMSTITGTGSQQRLVTAHLIQYYSAGGQTAPADEPTRTLPTKGRVAVVQALQLRADLLTPKQWRTARAAATLLREHFPERFPAAAGETPEIVMIGDYILVDIGLRMLRPRELARAQGFLDSYILDPPITFTDARGRTRTRRLTATEQVKLIGNSVCPQVAEALVRANLASLIRLYGDDARAA